MPIIKLLDEELDVLLYELLDEGLGPRWGEDDEFDEEKFEFHLENMKKKLYAARTPDKPAKSSIWDAIVASSKS